MQVQRNVLSFPPAPSPSPPSRRNRHPLPHQPPHHRPRQKSLLPQAHPQHDIPRKRHRIPKRPHDPRPPNPRSHPPRPRSAKAAPAEPHDKIFARDCKRLPQEELQHADCAFGGGDVERAREAEHWVGVHGSGDGKGEPELGVGGEVRAALDAEEVDEGGGVCRERLVWMFYS